MSDQPQAPAPQYVVIAGPKNGMGVTAFVLGLVGAVIALIPILGLFGIIMGLLAVVFGFIGYSRKRHGTATNGKMAMSGIILGAAAIVLGIIGLVIVDNAFEQLDEDLNEIGSIQQLG